MWVLDNVGSVLVADATGSGKTRMGAHLIAAAMHRLVWGRGRTRRDMLPVLICPGGVIDLWEHATEECGYAVETYSDGLLSRGAETTRARIDRGLRRAQVLAMDEAHRFLNRRSDRTQRILFNNIADFVMLFTATPVNRGPHDLLAIVDLLGADNFEDEVLDVLARLLAGAVISTRRCRRLTGQCCSEPCSDSRCGVRNRC
jgi:superfamily II DNA or RNA helicase